MAGEAKMAGLAHTASQPYSKKNNFFQWMKNFTLRIFLVLGEANRAAPILGAFHRSQTLLEGLQDVPLSLTFVREAILQAFHRSLCGVSTPRIECSSIHLPMDSKSPESEILHPKKFEKKFRFFVLCVAAAIFPHRATPIPF